MAKIMPFPTMPRRKWTALRKLQRRQAMSQGLTLSGQCLTLAMLNSRGDLNLPGAAAGLVGSLRSGTCPLAEDRYELLGAVDLAIALLVRWHAAIAEAMEDDDAPDVA